MVAAGWDEFAGTPKLTCSCGWWTIAGPDGYTNWAEHANDPTPFLVEGRHDNPEPETGTPDRSATG